MHMDVDIFIEIGREKLLHLLIQKVIIPSA